MSDNGTCFTSSEFQMFLRQNGVKHLLSAPYHPPTNGLAEQAVQVVKQGLKKVHTGSRIATVFFAYRLTPQTTTKTSPSELLFGRRLRSRLDLLKPNTAVRVELEQSKQVEQREKRSRERHFEVGDSVCVRNTTSGSQWSPGEVITKSGPVSYRVRLTDGRERRCHVEQIHKRTVEEHMESESPVTCG